MSAYRYCPQCAQPLVPRDTGERLRQACPDAACGYVYWENPTPVVAAIVEHEGRVLLARNRAWSAPFFALITGFLEKNEQPELAVLREVEEELGLQARDPVFIGHYRFERQNQLIIAYHVVAEGEVRLNEELAEYRHYAHDEVRSWPAATGLALSDWLRRHHGIEAPLLDPWPPR